MDAEQREWDAVRHGCGLLKGSMREILRVVGEDRVSFLQGMLTNDVRKLERGGGIHAALLTLQGKIVSDLRVYALDEEIWLDVPADRQSAVREALERYLVADDVEFADTESCRPLLALEGPASARTLLAVIGAAPVDLPPLSHWPVSFEGAELRVVAASHAGEEGFLLFGPQSIGAVLSSRAEAAGAVPIGAKTLDGLRIEAGIPRYGVDMDDSTLIGEAGLAQAISFTKGCYLGQEVVERVAARGQVQKKLVGLRISGSIVPPATSHLFVGDVEAGWTTSATWSRSLEAVIALAYVRRDHWDEGTKVMTRDGVEATVVALPFVGVS